MDLRPIANEVLIAAVAHPKCKLGWLPPTRKMTYPIPYINFVSLANKVPIGIYAEAT